MSAKSAECRCESNFTCGHCLRNAKPWLFTPSGGGFYFSRMNDAAIQRDLLREKKIVARVPSP